MVAVRAQTRPFARRRRRRRRRSLAAKQGVCIPKSSPRRPLALPYTNATLQHCHGNAIGKGGPEGSGSTVVSPTTTIILAAKHDVGIRTRTVTYGIE